MNKNKLNLMHTKCSFCNEPYNEKDFVIKEYRNENGKICYSRRHINCKRLIRI